MNIVELELSPNQRFLAWTDRANDINHDFTVMNLDTNGDRNPSGIFVQKDISTSSYNPNIPKASGIEFLQEGVGNFYLFVGFNTFGSDPSKDGIYHYSILNDVLTLRPNTSDFVKSHIERAINGRCYAVSANALLDISASTVTTLPSSTDYFPYLSTGANLANYQNPNHSGIYVLPDQVDGEIVSSNYSLPDVSQFVGNICKSDVILQFPVSISNYTITVERAFQTPCVYQGTARTLDLTTVCGIQCGGNECDNRYRIRIEATLCNGQEVSSQSGVFHVLCGPQTPVIKVKYRSLCIGQTTPAEVVNSYPQGTLIEWFEGSNLVATGQNATGLSGSFTVRVTDTNGCSVEQRILLSLRDCDLEPGGSADPEATSSQSDFVLYPNPAKTQVTIKLPSDEVIETISVKDVTGMTMQKHNAVSKVNQTIDVSKLRTGLYIVEVISKTNKQYVSKLIVE